MSRTFHAWNPARWAAGFYCPKCSQQGATGNPPIRHTANDVLELPLDAPEPDFPTFHAALGVWQEEDPDGVRFYPMIHCVTCEHTWEERAQDWTNFDKEEDDPCDHEIEIGGKRYRPVGNVDELWRTLDRWLAGDYDAEDEDDEDPDEWPDYGGDYRD